jgi:hypothetical protein
MTQTFRLKKGQISFAEDRIVISDDAKKQKSITLLSTGVSSIWGIANIGKFEQSGDEFFHSFWIIFFILSLLMFFVTLLRSTNSLILLDNVKSIKVKRRFNNTLLDIKLKNDQLRRVIQVEDAEELKEYIEKFQNDLRGK